MVINQLIVINSIGLQAFVQPPFKPTGGACLVLKRCYAEYHFKKPDLLQRMRAQVVRHTFQFLHFPLFPLSIAIITSLLQLLAAMCWPSATEKLVANCEIIWISFPGVFLFFLHLCGKRDTAV